MCQLPLGGEEAGFRGVVDLVAFEALEWRAKDEHVDEAALGRKVRVSYILYFVRGCVPTENGLFISRRAVQCLTAVNWGPTANPAGSFWWLRASAPRDGSLGKLRNILFTHTHTIHPCKLTLP